MSGLSFHVATGWEKNCSAEIDNLQMNLHGLRINSGLEGIPLSNYETSRAPGMSKQRKLRRWKQLHAKGFNPGVTS